MAMAHVWKACLLEKVSRVRVPPPPPQFREILKRLGSSRHPTGRHVEWQWRVPLLPLIKKCLWYNYRYEKNKTYYFLWVSINDVSANRPGNCLC